LEKTRRLFYIFLIVTVFSLSFSDGFFGRRDAFFIVGLQGLNHPIHRISFFGKQLNFIGVSPLLAGRDNFD
jgi:hypothetical protein